MTIIERMKTLYNDGKGFKQNELAAAVGCSTRTVGSWFTRPANPPADKLTAISDFLGVSVMWLLTGDDTLIGQEHYSNINHSIVKSANSKMEATIPREFDDFSKEMLRVFKGLTNEKKVAALSVLYEMEKSGPRVVPETPQGLIEFENLSTPKKTFLIEWIKRELQPIETLNKKTHDSFLRNLYSADVKDGTDHYVTIGEFSGAMVYCGFDIATTAEGRNYFNVSEKSPAIKNKKK